MAEAAETPGDLSRRESFALAVGVLGVGLGVFAREAQAGARTQVRYYVGSSRLLTSGVPAEAQKALDRGKTVTGKFVSGSKTLDTFSIKLGPERRAGP